MLVAAVRAPDWDGKSLSGNRNAMGRGESIGASVAVSFTDCPRTNWDSEWQRMVKAQFKSPTLLF